MGWDFWILRRDVGQEAWVRDGKSGNLLTVARLSGGDCLIGAFVLSYLYKNSAEWTFSVITAFGGFDLLDESPRR